MAVQNGNKRAKVYTSFKCILSFQGGFQLNAGCHPTPNSLTFPKGKVTGYDTQSASYVLPLSEYDASLAGPQSEAIWATAAITMLSKDGLPPDQDFKSGRV